LKHILEAGGGRTPVMLRVVVEGRRVVMIRSQDLRIFR
jgi:hypothetical protein